MDQQDNQANQNTKQIDMQNVLERVLARVSGVLTISDMQNAVQLVDSDATGEGLKNFLVSKVPNFELILQEEIESSKKE